MTATPDLVAIHQPNFFPWLGYFDKIDRADRFIVLDNAQFSKSGGTWSNRVRLLAGGQPLWATMPVVRGYHGVRQIRDMQIDTSSPWRRKFLQTLRTNYSRAPFFDTLFPFVSELVQHPTASLLEFNLRAITAICELVGIDTSKLVLGSSLPVSGQATELLISSVQAVGGQAYFCGGGAEGYQEDRKFHDAGLRLHYQNFQHPVYPQVSRGEFVPGLSCIDALMCCGPERFRPLLSGPR